MKKTAANKVLKHKRLTDKQIIKHLEKCCFDDTKAYTNLVHKYSDMCEKYSALANRYTECVDHTNRMMHTMFELVMPFLDKEVREKLKHMIGGYQA